MQNKLPGSIVDKNHAPEQLYFGLRLYAALPHVSTCDDITFLK